MSSRAREAEREEGRQLQQPRRHDERSGSHRSSYPHESSHRSNHATPEEHRHSSRRDGRSQQDAASSTGPRKRHREHGERGEGHSSRRESSRERERSRSPVRRRRGSETERSAAASPPRSRGREDSPPPRSHGKRKRSKSRDSERPPSHRARRDSHSAASDHSRRRRRSPSLPPRKDSSRRPPQGRPTKQAVPPLPPNISLADPHLHLPRQRSPSPPSDPAFLYHLSLPPSLFPLIRGPRASQLTAYSNLTRLTPVQANATKGTSAFVQLIGSREAIAECCEAIRRVLEDLKEEMSEEQRMDFEGVTEWVVESEIDELGESKEDFVERAKRLAREKEEKGKGKVVEKEPVPEQEEQAREPPRQPSRELPRREPAPRMQQDNGWGSRGARASTSTSQDPSTSSSRAYEPEYQTPQPPLPPPASEHNPPLCSADPRADPSWALGHRRSYMLANMVQQCGPPDYCIVVPPIAVSRIIGRGKQTLQRIEALTSTRLFLDDMDQPPVAYIFGGDGRRAEQALSEMKRVVREIRGTVVEWEGAVEKMPTARASARNAPPAPPRQSPSGCRPTRLGRPASPRRPPSPRRPSSPPPHRDAPPPRRSSPAHRGSLSPRRVSSPPPRRPTSPPRDQDRSAPELRPLRAVSPFRPPASFHSRCINRSEEHLFSYAAAPQRSPPRSPPPRRRSRSASPPRRLREGDKAAYDSDDSDLVIIDPSPDEQRKKDPATSARQSGATSSKSSLSAVGSASSLFEQTKESKGAERGEHGRQPWISPATSTGRAEVNGKDEVKSVEKEQEAKEDEAMEAVGDEEVTGASLSADPSTEPRTPPRMDVDSDEEEEDEIILAVSPAAKLLDKKSTEEFGTTNGDTPRGSKKEQVTNGYISDDSSDSDDSDASVDEEGLSAPLPTTSVSTSNDLPFPFPFASTSVSPANCSPTPPTLFQARASLASSLASLDALGEAPRPYPAAELAVRREEKARRREEKVARREERKARNEERGWRREWRATEERVEREKEVVERLERAVKK